MAEAHSASPYTVPPAAAVDGRPPVYVVPQMHEYAVADPVDSGRDFTGPEAGWDNSGKSTELRTSPTGTPDANRLRLLPLFETRPGEGEPVAWWQRFGWVRDKTQRHSVEYQDADGHEIRKENPRMVERPRPSDTGEPRPTLRMNPSTYRFTAPGFWAGFAREFNGVHFSMADHRRDYPIMGMQPAPERRNTYRLEPTPWDAAIVDMPPDVSPAPNARTVAPAVAPAGNRSWRL